MQKRIVDVVVVSDLHLGTYACRANEFLAYLKSITPRLLILNGDIIDGWQFSKHYFPSAHMAVIREIFHLLAAGTRVIYLTGNHDEVLRRYADVELGNFQLADKVVIEINGKLTWVFHGDVFDHTTKGQAKFWTRLGSNGYALLLGFNSLVNRLLHCLGRPKISLSKKIMAGFHKRLINIQAFESKIAELAIEKNYHSVICGHIHQPQKRIINTEKGSVLYMNSGDWVEHLCAIEYCEDDWHIFHYDEKDMQPESVANTKPEPDVLTDEIAVYFHSLSHQPVHSSITSS
jgi:UDP-2,3-diacylglucosamine pyrophosphatase LpxH